MKKNRFTQSDIETIEREGLTVQKVSSQLTILHSETIPVTLERPCSVNDGIMAIPESEKTALISRHEEAAAKGRMTKFVPASGAASRMFRNWFNYYETEDFKNTEEAGVLEDEIVKFAFYPDVEKVVSSDGRDPSKMLREDISEILEYILTPTGLNYAHLPKALLKFHAYPDHNRTPLEEHLVEAAMYTQDEDCVCRLHITVSGEHESKVQEYLSGIKKYYETRYNVRFQSSLSIQFPSTNTIAVDEKGIPFRDTEGRIMFRPGGHGALLKNLNAIEEDIIFIKNIDNVVPDRLKPETVHYKKILGGYLSTLQEQIFQYLHFLNENTMKERQLSEIMDFCRGTLCSIPSSDFENIPDTEKREILFNLLNRPLRVCGMVKNEGEPGGGPFWVRGKKGEQSLQIVEKAQVNVKSEAQRSIWESSSYFNPVDLVCSITDYRGEKFDLRRYVDGDTWIVSNKSYEGKPLKILEHPGLWNGSMAGWNTVFVEVPSITFNPVKTVEDLLRDEHQETIT